MSTEAWASAQYVLFTKLPEVWAQVSEQFPDITADDVFTAAAKVAEIAKLCFVGEEQYRDTSWTYHYEVQPLLWFELSDLEDMNTDEKVARVLLTISLVSIVVNPFFGPKGRLKNLTFITYQLLQSYITALIVLESQCREFREHEFTLKTNKINELTSQLALIQTLKNQIHSLKNELAEARIATENANAATANARAAAQEYREQVTRLETIVGGVTDALENHQLDQRFLVTNAIVYHRLVDNLHTLLQVAANAPANAHTLQLLTDSVAGNLADTRRLVNVLEPITLALGDQDPRLAITDGEGK